LEQRLYSIPDVLRQVPRSHTQIYRDMAAGLLPFVQVGRRRYVEPQGLDAYIGNLKGAPARAHRLSELVGEDGRIDVSDLADFTLADLEAAKRFLAERRAAAA
jgi:hypothetical protein